jgi:prolyl-tRNA editing enzyme YbaK/EbsC (Cys-tRNA(Pro) deacylase)
LIFALTLLLFLNAGYMHNAVTPFGMTNSSIPVVLCSNCLQMENSYIYLGGGKVNVKVGMPIADFIRATNPIIAAVSYPR